MTSFRAGVVIACLVLAGLPARAEDAAGVTESRLHEPVFGGEVQVYTAGPAQAPAVVLIHGLGDKAARDWEGLIPVLAREHRVLAFDLPGFGRSSKDNAPYTPTNYAALVRFVIERELGLRPVAIVAHSLGGAIALRYAALYPRDTSALVLVDVPGILHRVAYSKYLTQLGIGMLPNLYPAQNDQLRTFTGNLFGWVERLKPAPEAIVANPKLRKNFLSASPTKIAGLALALEDFSGDLPRVTMPTLLLWGGRDELAPLRNGRALAAMLPEAQLEVFPASGHTPMDDVPVEFAARVERFLRAPALDRVDTVLREPLVPLRSERRGECRGQHDLEFEGDYDTLVIERCRDVQVRNARIRMLRIVDSRVVIEGSRIGGPDGGLVVDDGRVTLTSSRIEARVAITAISAHLDLAGVRIVGTEDAVRAPQESQLLFSISELQSPHFSGRMHGLRAVRPGEPL